MALLGLGSLLLGSWATGVSLLIVGSFFAGLAVVVRLSGLAVPLVNTSFNALLQGRVAEAERLLDQVEGRRQLGYIHRVVDLQRASIALRRGDLDAALARVDAALARPPGLLTGGQEAPHLAAARAMRALIRASRDDRQGARADAAAVRRSPSAPAEALARAEVAEAIALERSGDREALAAHLAEKRALLLDSTAPRERAVVRAYQRMLRAPKSSVYRRSASRDAPAAAATDGEPTVADWIARVAPAAAPFARAARAPSPDGAAPASAEVIEPGLVRVAEARLEGNAGPYPSASRARVAAAWVLLVLFACLLWMLFYEPGDAVELLAFVPRSAGALLGWTVALLAGSAALRVARNARYDRRLAVAVSAVARGDAGAVAEIEAVARVTSVPAAPQALLQLARLAVRRADFDEALRRCDQGIAVVTARGSAGVAASMLLPDLVAERAFVLAATDRHAKAAAEMAVLVKTFPAYPFLARAELRVGLVSRARRGDLAGAARLVAGDTDDLPLSLRDETLADLVRASAHPETIGAGEVQRLSDELRFDADLRAWLKAVAPGPLRAFEAQGAFGPVRLVPDAPRDAEAEREALAEGEAQAAEQEEHRSLRQ